MDRRIFVASTAAAMASMATLIPGPALAQANARVARIVVPFAAGGVQDILARAMSTELAAALGQTVIVENRPGAGGTVGHRLCRQVGA